MKSVVVLNNPQPAIITQAFVVANHDGDTVTVEIRRRFSVRIRGIDTPELKEKGGKEARDFVKSELPVNKEVTVVIPTNNPLNLMDVNSFGRIVGDVWYDGKNLKEELEKNGHIKNKS
jgi:endonuclease YncB( thermonuclease family)